MTRFHALLVFTAIGAITVTLSGQRASPAAALFQQGLLVERAEGDVNQAIVLYERVIAEYPGDAAVLPQVLSHLAQTYDRRNDPRAMRMWSRLVADFGSTSYADEARKRLAAANTEADGPFRNRPIDTPDARLDVLGFSTDGQTVAYRKHVNGADEIWLRDIDSGRDRRVFQEAGRVVESVTWSPDSRHVSVMTSPAGAAGGGNFVGRDLRVLGSQGGPRRIVATAGSGRVRASWSPDSRWLFADVGWVPNAATTEIRLIETASGQSRKLAGPSFPSSGAVWSRDSRQVIFQTPNAAGDPSFWIAAVEAGEIRPWTTPLTGKVNLATGVTRLWTTDNRVLVRQQEPPGFSFYLVPVTGGVAEKTCTSTPDRMECRPGMTPDGRIRVALDTVAKRLMLFDLGKLDTPRRATTGFGSETSPNLSADGRLLAFASNTDGKWALYIVPVDRAPASAVRVAQLGSDDFSAPAWTTSGRLVGDIYTEDEDIFRINMDSAGHAVGAAGRLTQDTRVNGWPTVSPESDRVAYTYESGLAVMTADGGGERPVLQAKTQGHLQWRSTDEVLFQRASELGSPSSISALNVKTGAVQTVIDLPPGRIIWQYVPARNEVFYVAITGPGQALPAAGSKQVLHARSISTGADRVVTEMQELSPYLYAFRVSPDGTQIAYGRYAGAGEARHVETHLMSVDGQRDRALSTSGAPYDWSPDGRFLLHGLTVKGVTHVAVTDVRSGESWPVEQAEDSDTVEWDDAQWAPNGSFIVLYRDSWHDDYRVFDGLTYDAVVKLMGVKR